MQAVLGVKFIRPSKPMRGSIIYTVAFLEMEVNRTMNSAESTGAKNANIACPANIAGSEYGNMDDNKLGKPMMNRRVRVKPAIPQSQARFRLPFVNRTAKKPT